MCLIFRQGRFTKNFLKFLELPTGYPQNFYKFFCGSLDKIRFTLLYFVCDSKEKNFGGACARIAGALFHVKQHCTTKNILQVMKVIVENGYRVADIETLKKRDMSDLKDATFIYEDERGMIMHCKYIKQLKQGEYFTLKPTSIDEYEVKERNVYVRDYYDRAQRKYSIFKFSDVCAERFVKGNKLVYVDFTF